MHCFTGVLVLEEMSLVGAFYLRCADSHIKLQTNATLPVSIAEYWQHSITPTCQQIHYYANNDCLTTFRRVHMSSDST